MANNLYDKLINSEIPFLVLSSFCVYNFVTYSTKNRKVRNSKNEFTNLSIIEIDVHKEGKFGNVLSLLKHHCLFSLKFIYSEKATKFLRNLPLTFDHSTYSQKLVEDFAKFCGLLRIYELYLT